MHLPIALDSIVHLTRDHIKPILAVSFTRVASDIYPVPNQCDVGTEAVGTGYVVVDNVVF